MYIVTGGAGFIGSAFLWQLNSQGITDILVVDNLGSSSKWRNLVKRSYRDYIHRDRFRDLLSRNALPHGIEAVIHLGACSSTTEENADFLMENNFHYSLDVCRYCLEKDIRVIVASSAATYGDGTLGFSDALECVPFLQPLNMYGYSKQLLDQWILSEHVEGRIASLKFFNVYGPNEYHKGSMRSVVAKAFDEITARGRVSLFASNTQDFGNGEQMRDFVYVKDCALLLSWLLENPGICGIRNVGTGCARSFNDLAKAVFSALQTEPLIDYVAMPEHLAPNYQNYTCADMGWLLRDSYPHRFSSLEEGVRDYVCNYLVKKDRYL